jgi:hypothetical protein
MTTFNKHLTSIVRSGTGLFVLGSVLLAQNSQNVAQVSMGAPSGGAPSTNHAPEIDVALAGGALALVIGGLFIVTAIRRKRLART